MPVWNNFFFKDVVPLQLRISGRIEQQTNGCIFDIFIQCRRLSTCSLKESDTKPKNDSGYETSTEQACLDIFSSFLGQTTPLYLLTATVSW